jgi:RNase P subunit RPR2
MGERNRGGRPRGAAQRKKRALEASANLSEILSKPWNHSNRIVDAAALQMWRIGTRHQIGLHPEQRIWICRGCHTLLRPGITARIRIQHGRRITTCLRCNRISRRGPDFPHEVAK